MTSIKKEQLEFLDWEFGVFFHFGIRTFYEGHIDWDRKEMPLEGFNPTELDCEQWIRTIKEAGAKYAVLVCKHHDGFANWPSKYTKYSVANTPWKDGKGDVVREFTDACRKYDIKVGLYCSAAQFETAEMSDKEYDDFFIDQLRELLSNYGKVDYLWFDACGSENHQFDTVRIVNEIRTMQPELLIFNMWDPDTRWVGNESGYAEMPNYNIVKDLDVSVLAAEKEELQGNLFLPAECDCRIRFRNWFYSSEDLHTLKSVDELVGIYYYSVGRGANLLLNIGPDRNGLLPAEDAARIIEFGKKVKERFSDSQVSIQQIERKENSYFVAFSDLVLMNHVVLQEKISADDYVKKFSIYIYPVPGGRKILVYQGNSIGHKHICLFPTISTKQVEIVIEEETGNHELKEIQVLYTNK